MDAEIKRKILLMKVLTKEQYYIVETEAQYLKYCDQLEILLWEKKKKSLEVQKRIKLLTLLIELWEKEKSQLQTEDSNPVQLLDHLMKENKIKQKELAEKLGVSKSLISDILSYRRGMSKEIIRGLSSFFKMSQEAFNRPYQLEG